jgi:hypothetical protein
MLNDAIRVFFYYCDEKTPEPIRVRRVANILNKHTIPKIVLNLLTTCVKTVVFCLTTNRSLNNMKTTFFIGMTGLMTVMPVLCFGADFIAAQCAQEDTTCTSYTEYTGGKTNCSSYGNIVYVGCKRVYTCNTCKTNYQKTAPTGRYYLNSAF